MYTKIEKMIKDLELRGCDSIKNRVFIIKKFCEFYNHSPELLGEKDIINYLDYCINQKKLCSGTVNAINSTLNFFML